MSQLRSRLSQIARRQRELLRFRVLNPLGYVAQNASIAFDPKGTAGERICRILLVSDAQVLTSEEQLNPFFSYRRDLRRQLKVISLHLLTEDVLRLPRFALRMFDIIGLKLSFRMSAAEVKEIQRALADKVGAKPVIYLDGDDDLCIMHPEMLSWVDLYVKKHVFRDRSRYLQKFVGKSNLTDFVHHEYNYSFADDPIAKECPAVDSNGLGKIIVGWNVALDSNMIALFNGAAPNHEPTKRTVDVMFRGSVPKDWLHHLRKDVEPSLKNLQSMYTVIIPKERVSRDEYYREMKDSKICVSPFGYGEICWRDFEAIICGCLLIKPDMSHVETRPDIFRAFETYVPVRWDYGDLEQKCSYYLDHEDQRLQIVTCAYEVLRDYYGRKEFLTAMSEILFRIPGLGRHKISVSIH